MLLRLDRTWLLPEKKAQFSTAGKRTQSLTDFLTLLNDTAQTVEPVIAQLLASHADGHEKLAAAMRYGALGPGKRLRPFLLLATARMFDVPKANALHAAAAIECLHAYSLIHDDLPAMDNDDLRRGRPTTHIKFDEATAILAGDGLLTFAFEILALDTTHPDPAVRCALMELLARAAGSQGMIAGQMLDIEAEANPVEDLDAIQRIQRLKTGALFEFSCVAGGILGRAENTKLDHLRQFARHFGVAFQMTDDLLDHEGDEREVGKRTGKDAVLGKATFVGVLGVEGAREQTRRHIEAALSCLESFGQKAKDLHEAAQFLAGRKS